MGNALNRNTLGQNRTYTYNTLNQMVSGTVPTATDAAGTVGPGIVEPKVTVNNIPVPPAEPDPEGNWIVRGIPLVSGENILTTLVKDKFNRTKTDTRTVTVAPAPEFSYDPNGNMLSLPSLGSLSSLSLTWNDENRLSSASIANDKKLEFLYDGQGRRRVKKVYSWSGSDWTLQTESRYAYDQWNEVAEYRSANSSPFTLHTSYFWGIDLSGSEQGAGGVGGLLAVDSHAFHFPVYDGNGNITVYADSNDAVVYSCFYTPFGKVIDENGTKPCPYGFSTKPLDSETGLVYYIFRDYSPDLGRWISRDPIGEAGGWHLYVFVLNNFYYYDYLGHSSSDEKDKCCPTNQNLLKEYLGDQPNAVTPEDVDNLIKYVSFDLAVSFFGGVFIKGGGKACNIIKSAGKGGYKRFPKGQLLKRLEKVIKDDGIKSIEHLKTKSGKKAGQYDLFLDDKGNIIILKRDGTGIGEETGYNIFDLLKE